MKNLKFVLKNDDSIVINSLVQYDTSNDFIFFEIDNVSFKLKINNEKFVFRRETIDDIFELENNSAFVELKNENARFYVNLLSYKYTFNDKNILIKYSLESDEGVEKTIEITFEN